MQLYDNYCQDIQVRLRRTCRGVAERKALYRWLRLRAAEGSGQHILNMVEFYLLLFLLPGLLKL